MNITTFTMSKPLEDIQHNVRNKIKILEKIIDITIKDNHDNKKLQNHKQKFENIKKIYNRDVVVILCDYYSNTDQKQKQQIINNFNTMLIRNNILTYMDNISNNITKMIQDNYIIINNKYVMNQLLNKYLRIKYNINVKKFNLEICPVCNSHVIKYPQRSELVCTKCTYNIILKGTIFDETQFYSQDGVNIKNGNNELIRHCRYHLKRILGLGYVKVDNRLLNKIYGWIHTNNIRYPKTLKYSDYRRCLKNIRETKHNEAIAYIKQIISGRSSGYLHHDEFDKTCIYLVKAITTYKEIFGFDCNLKYNPYFILKILPMILRSDNDKERLNEIISCIHFQEPDTIITNDKIWEKICREVPEFQFIKTNKHLIQMLL